MQIEQERHTARREKHHRCFGEDPEVVQLDRNAAAPSREGSDSRVEGVAFRSVIGGERNVRTMFLDGCTTRIARDIPKPADGILERGVEVKRQEYGGHETGK